MKSVLTALLLLTLASPALAQEAAQHAFALHGDPKYPATYTHFDYTNPDAPKGGALNLSAIGTFDSLNPFIVKGVPAGGMAPLGQSLIYDSLMEQSYDEPFTMYGLIAESVEHPKDNSWVAFNLNKAAKWADGKPITAGDVVWTFNTMLKEGTPFFKAYYGDVKDVLAESESRVKFTFAHNNNKELPLIISQMAILPQHFWEGKKFAQTTLETPLGSGPYKIGKVVAGRSVQYVRDENYWGKDLAVNKGRFNFDKITYTYFRDSNVALEAFFGGQFDIIQEQVAKLWATAYNAPPTKDGRVIKEEIPNTRPTGMQGFIYNIRRPVFQDDEVRKALAYAFDFDWSNKQFAYGAYTRTQSYFENSPLASKGLPQGRELEILEKYRGKIPDEVFTTTYKAPATDGSGNNRDNMKQAAAILDAAGYKLGKDGIRVNDKGTRLEFEIIDNNPAFERWTMPFVQNLKKIGVKASYRVIDDAQYTNRMQNFDFDMTTLVIAQSDSPGNEQRDFWASEKADIPGSRNYIGIKSPVVDELIELIINAPDRAELEARCKALDRILLANHYVVPHWYYGAWRIAWWKKLAHPDKLSGLTPAITDTWWVRPEAAAAKAE